jgi:hypothetical protein
MSYFGTKFPEGITPDYREIGGAKEITCPNLKRVTLKALSSEDTKYFTCDGCGEKEAVIMVVDLETERLFVRKDSACADGHKDGIVPIIRKS